MSTALYTLRQSIGRGLGSGLDVPMVLAAATGGLATTGCQASALGVYENDYFNDWFLRFYMGTHKDTTRTVTDFAKTNGVLTWDPALAAAADITDYFELWRDDTVSPDQLNAFINEAIQSVETDALTDKVDESIVANSVLTDGLFETWTSSSAATYWTTTGTGTLARESTIKVEGSYSAKLTNTATNAFGVQQSVTNPGKYAGKTASLYARVHCMTASRARIRLTDGVTTWNSDYHTGGGWLDSENDPYLKIEGVTLSTAITELTASCRIETGAAIDAYVDKMYLVCGDAIYEYTIPTGFYTLENVFQEDSTTGVFSQKSGRIDAEKGWTILGNGSTKKLWLDPDIVSLTTGRRLRLEGQGKPSSLILDADTTDVPAAYIVNYVRGLITGKTAYFGLAEQQRRNMQVALRGQRVDS